MPAILAALAVAASLTVPAVPGTPAAASDLCDDNFPRIYMTSSGAGHEADDLAIKAALETIGGTPTGVCVTVGVQYSELASVATDVTFANYSAIYLRIQDNPPGSPQFTPEDAAVVTDLVAAGRGLIVNRWAAWLATTSTSGGWPAIEELLPAHHDSGAIRETRLYRWDRAPDARLDAAVAEDFVLPGLSWTSLHSPKVGAAVPYFLTAADVEGVPPEARAFDREPGERDVNGAPGSRVWAGLATWEIPRADGAGAARVASLASQNSRAEIADTGSSVYSADLRRLVANTLAWSSGLGDPIAPLQVCDVRVYMTSSGGGWVADDAAVAAALEEIGGDATGLCVTVGVQFFELADVAGDVTSENFDVVYVQKYLNWTSHPHFSTDDADVLTAFVDAGGGLVVSGWTVGATKWGSGSGWPAVAEILPASYDTSGGREVRLYRWDRAPDSQLDVDVDAEFVFPPWEVGFHSPKVGAAVPYFMTGTVFGGEPPAARAFDREPGEAGGSIGESVWAGLASWELPRADGLGDARVAALATTNLRSDIADTGSASYSADLRQLVANTLLWASGLGDPIAPLPVGPAAPGTPVAPSVVAGEEQVTVTVVEPSSGDAPTSWTVTAAPGGATCTVPGASGSCTVTGLDPALSYTFTATATNDGGTSAASPQSLSVTPLAATPPAPTPTYAEADVQDRVPTVVGGGELVVGATLEAPGVSWSNSPTSLSWKWQACTDWMWVPASCVEETTATDTLVIPAAFAGRGVRVVASATNAGGTGTASAVWRTGTVAAAPTDPDPGAGPEVRSVSTAGAEWTARPDAPQQSWNAVAYGGGVWVAVSDDGTRRVMRSIDGGVTWSSDGITGADTSAGDNARAWRSVAYGADQDGEGGVWIAVGGSPGPAALRSTDGGLTWTEQALPIARTWSSVAHADGTWIAVAPNANDRLIRSTDGGLNWTEHTLPRSSDWRSVAGDGEGTWVAVASDLRATHSVARSTDDGVTWTEVTDGPMADHRWQAVTFAPDPGVPGEGVWIATAVVGATRVMRSTDGGVSWTGVPVTGSDDATWVSVGYGDGVLVAVSGNGPLGDEALLRTMRSTDLGATWEVNPAAAFNQWTSVAFGAGSWVAVSRGGSSLRVMTSGASVTSTDPDDGGDDGDAAGGGGDVAGGGGSGSTGSGSTGSGSDGSGSASTGPAPTWIAGTDGRAPSLPQGAALVRLPDGTEVPLTLVWDGDARVRLTVDATGTGTSGTGASGSGAPAAGAPGSIEAILSGAVRRGPSGEVVVDPDGEVSIELRGPVAAGTLDVWMFSTPRHLATVTVNGAAVQTFVLPLGAPADGGGPVAAGAHTLQLVVPTDHGRQAVDVALTVGSVAGTGAESGPVPDAVSGAVSDAVSGPVPTGVPAGEGAGQAGSAGLALALLLGAGVASLAQVERRRRAVEAGRVAGR